MGKRSVPAFAAITLVVIAAAWLSSRERAPETDVDSRYFLPELQAGVNEVTRVVVASPTERTVIERQGEGWVLPERGGYPADFEKVKSTVLSLAELRSLEPKTANPEMYWRIGVEDIDAESSTSRQVSLEDADGRSLASVVLGKEREPRMRPGLDGEADIQALYVREAGERQSFLVAGAVELSARPADWVDRRIADVPGERVSQVRIAPAEGTAVVLGRALPSDGELALESLPEGRVPRSQAMLSSLATVLKELRFEDVYAREEVDFPEQAVDRAELRTFDGLVAQIESAEIDGRRYARFSFSHDPDAALPVAQPADAEGQTDAAAAQPSVPVAEEAALLQRRVEPWVYVLPEFKGAMLSRDLEALTRVRPEQTNVRQAPAATPFLPAE